MSFPGFSFGLVIGNVLSVEAMPVLPPQSPDKRNRIIQLYGEYL